MRIDSIRQWQWVVISLVIGLSVGYLREQTADDLGAQYGSEINDQARFEQALVNVEQGRPWFTDLRVASRSLPDRNGIVRRVSLVSGMYFNGHPEPRDGKLLATWEKAFFIAPIPYKPASRLLEQGDGKGAARFAAVAHPTVTDFLDALGSVRYSRAWWQGLRMWQWVVLCFVTIGIVWPVLLNLMVFGTWRRPREEKGIDLSKVKLPPEEPKKPGVTDEEIAELAAMSDDLEQQLAEGAVASSESPQSVVAAPIRELTTSAVILGQTRAQDDVEYGAKPDDFYPTAKATPVDHKKSAPKA